MNALPRLAATCALLCGPWVGSQAAQTPFCSQDPVITASQQDRLLRFGAAVKQALSDSGQTVALIARSGTDLSRFGVRYSHAGLSLQANPAAPWAIRQLYYACDEQQPRLFDQGMSGFVLGGSNPDLGFVSLVFLPMEKAEPLERAALNNTLALQLLGATYSANAYPFSATYQNCNQWVAELLATAWGQPVAAAEPRTAAQRWLLEAGYTPTVFEAGNPVTMWVSALVPLLHRNDHPAEDLAAWRYRVSTPRAIESFVQANLAGARRVELCHTTRQVVVRQGWEPLPDDCTPGPNDTVLPLD